MKRYECAFGKEKSRGKKEPVKDFAWHVRDMFGISVQGPALSRYA